MTNQPEHDAPSQPTAALPTTRRITLMVNGAAKPVDVAPWTTLLDALREGLELTGTKKGCDHGQCGACTVLVDGRRILACLTLAIMKDGAAVTTVEGLVEGDALHPLQHAFIEHDAFQCGYCTPGQICSAVGLMREGRAKSADDIRELMSGNLCRCGALITAPSHERRGMHQSSADHPHHLQAVEALRASGARISAGHDGFYCEVRSTLRAIGVSRIAGLRRIMGGGAPLY